MQTLIKDGIVPTTIAFQDLVKKGIMPMLTGTQVKALEESKKSQGAIKPEDSLSKGEEIISSLTSNTGKLRGTYNNLAASETPKLEMIAQKEKEAQEKIELERQQAANREQLRKEEIMAMNGPAGQNSPGGEATDLNTALRELIAINKRTADLNEKQLSVQSGLSGDLFA
jgi:hypothetical protein